MRKPIRSVIGRPPALRPFRFQGLQLWEFHHRYNTTWANERCVELAIALHFVRQTPPREVLEVGHVLGHYAPRYHTVVDLSERAPGVHNIDINDYQPDRRFGLIVSVSTLEHVGFDWPSRRSLNQTVAHLRSLLRPGGRLLLTIPTGYNPAADELALSGTCLHRTASGWVELARPHITPYGYPFPYANTVSIVA